MCSPLNNVFGCVRYADWLVSTSLYIVVFVKDLVKSDDRAPSTEGQRLIHFRCYSCKASKFGKSSICIPLLHTFTSSRELFPKVFCSAIRWHGLINTFTCCPTYCEVILLKFKRNIAGAQVLSYKTYIAGAHWVSSSFVV